MKIKELKNIYWTKLSIDEIEEELKASYNDELQELLKDKLLEYSNKIIDAENYIETFENEKAKAIARMRYLNFKTWKEINKIIYNGYCDESASRKYIESFIKTKGE